MRSNRSPHTITILFNNPTIPHFKTPHITGSDSNVRLETLPKKIEAFTLGLRSFIIVMPINDIRYRIVFAHSIVRPILVYVGVGTIR